MSSPVEASLNLERCRLYLFFINKEPKILLAIFNKLWKMSEVRKWVLSVQWTGKDNVTFEAREQEQFWKTTRGVVRKPYDQFLRIEKDGFCIWCGWRKHLLKKVLIGPFQVQTKLFLALPHKWDRHNFPKIRSWTKIQKNSPPLLARVFIAYKEGSDRQGLQITFLNLWENTISDLLLYVPRPVSHRVCCADRGD